ncbi:MAG: sulfotransferase [Vicinamibacterales bacterium]
MNCLIIGAQKAGTTALARFLSEHPDVCVAPAKEAHLFDSPAFEDTRAYCDACYAEAFPNFSGQRIVLEATPIYMYLPIALGRIARYNPAMRLIAVLRNPSERAVSHYTMERRRGREPLSFAAAIAAEPFRLWYGRGDLAWGSVPRAKSYVHRGFYSRQIQEILRVFPRDQLLLLRMDDLRHDYEATMDAVYRFLSVPRPATLPAPREIRPNVALSAGAPPPDDAAGDIRLASWVPSLLAAVYRREITRLERLMETDLSGWRTPIRSR